MSTKKILSLLLFIAICQFVGIAGAFFTSPVVSSNWYVSLEKPFFNPPSWIFSPVWITLYALMGISAYLIWQKGWKKVHIKRALVLFFVHLFFNGIWSILFFGLQNPFYAFLDIVVLWILIIATILKFAQIKKLAAYLMLPYLIWVTFAMILNYYLWILN